MFKTNAVEEIKTHLTFNHCFFLENRDFYGKMQRILLTLREERKRRAFENMVLRRIFGPRGDEVTGEWRKLHNEELNDLYSSPNIVGVINSRRIRWAGHVARMGEEKGNTGSWWGNRSERDHWEDLGIDGWIILGRISRRWDLGIWTGLGWPRIETGGGRL